MLAGAVAFYLVFGIIVPDVFYGTPDAANPTSEHPTIDVGQILRMVTPYFAAVLGLFAVVRFIKELRE